jgi:hypothetical protein
VGRLLAILPRLVLTVVLYPVFCEDDNARELSRISLFTLAVGAFVVWTVLSWLPYL